MRQRHGLKLIDKKGAAEMMPEFIKRGSTIGFIADQDAGRKGVFVDFFGRKASTYKSIGLLAITYNLPIIVGCTRRVGNRFYFNYILSRIIFPQEWADKDDPLTWVSAEYTKAIEDFVREDPTQYWWLHRRWKTRPKEERQAAEKMAEASSGTGVVEARLTVAVRRPRRDESRNRLTKDDLIERGEDMRTTVLAAVMLILGSAISPAQAKLVACVGDSITYGSGIANPAQDSYPSQLQRILQHYDPSWKVQNFGVSGATLLTKGDLPYVNQTAYSSAQLCNPDIVVIMLGTNDSKPQNWQYKGDFVSDYETMIDVFRGRPARRWCGSASASPRST